MILISAKNISKSYTERKLIDKQNLFINMHDKIGIIELNGAGKSTLIKILAGVEHLDAGEVVKSSNIKIEYLEQNPTFENEDEVLSYVLKNSEDTKEFEAKSILNKLGIKDLNRNINTMSGGEQKRIAIAKTLVTGAEVLILDEPTNHLDSDMITWLEEYLKKYNGAVVMITHDRYFLDRVSNKIIELERGVLSVYETNYTNYLVLKAQKEADEIATARKNKTFLKKELEWILQGPQGRGTKSKHRIERFKEISENNSSTEDEKLKISSVSSRLGKKTIELIDIKKSYEDKIIINNFNHMLLRDSRIGIVGQNGAGKSTLLKIILGEETPDSGLVDKGETVKIGYFSQQGEEMNINLKAIDYIKETAEYIQTTEGQKSASQMLETFMFEPDKQYTKIQKLSGGEKRRLFLLKVLMTAPNILVLDEPTNDLDVHTLMVLENYLDTFDGAVVCVSHDRYFLDKVATQIFELENGEITKYNGGYSDYEETKKIQNNKIEIPEQNSNNQKENKQTSKKENSNNQKQKKLKFSYNEQREFETIDEDILTLESEIENLEKEIEKNTTNYSKLNELMEQKKELENKLSLKMDRWMYLTELSSKIEKGE